MPPRASGSSSRAAAALADSDDEFIIAEEDDSGDDFLIEDDRPSRFGRGNRAAGKARQGGQASTSTGKPGSKKAGGPNGKDASKSYAWESTFQRSWDVVNEDESGSLEASVKHLLQAGKRKRAAREERRVRRGIIRHLVLVLDDSENMNEKDGGRARRIDVLLPIARRFVNEYFEQNPIGQLAILIMRDGLADRLVSMGGNTSDHLAALNNRRRLEPRGDPSLQNALEMAKSTLAHLPMTSSREVLLLSGSLTSCDPGNIHHTIASLKAASIRVDLIHLTAEMKILRDIARETGGTFGVALDDGHLEELIREGIRPREVLKKKEPTSTNGPRLQDEDEEDEDGAELMQMGFPLRLPTHAPPTLCACHSRLFPSSSGQAGGANSLNPLSGKARNQGTGSGFLCPRCGAKICDVPTDCPVCSLTVVMSTHLARSYRHLFPVKTWRAVSWESLAANPHPPPACQGCDEAFPPIPSEYHQNQRRPSQGANTNGSSTGPTTATTAVNGAADGTTATTNNSNLAPSSRYECVKCKSHFCLECDSYVHDELFVCPGCG